MCNIVPTGYRFATCFGIIRQSVPEIPGFENYPASPAIQNAIRSRMGVIFRRLHFVHHLIGKLQSYLPGAMIESCNKATHTATHLIQGLLPVADLFSSACSARILPADRACIGAILNGRIRTFDAGGKQKIPGIRKLAIPLPVEPAAPPYWSPA